jgi:dCMP deaminase
MPIAYQTGVITSMREHCLACGAVRAHRHHDMQHVPPRPSWDEYFLNLAEQVATRSTCNRKQVGCVLVRDKAIIATGYAGSIRGQPHCVDVGCRIDEQTGGCVRTVHAELNALAQAAKNGVSTEAAIAYCTMSPCYWCFKTLTNAGVKRFVYAEQYRIAPDRSEAEQCGVTLEHLAPRARASS